MKCNDAKKLLSAYLDGAVTGKQMGAISEHLRACMDCNRVHTSSIQIQQLLGKVGRRKAPEDLSLKLRLAISREIADRRRPYLEGFRARLHNGFAAFMLPVTAGLVAAVLIFGLLTGVLASPLQAQYPDVPLMLYTAPQLQQSAFGTGLDAIQEDSLVIEAYVDSNGRVQDYRILSNPDEGKDLPSPVKNMLIFTTFRPATSMGRPTWGRAVLSFSKISVKG